MNDTNQLLRKVISGQSILKSELLNEIQKVDKKVDKLDVRVGNLEKDMAIVKGELSIIRYHQVTRDEFKLLKNRVLALEQKAR